MCHFSLRLRWEAEDWLRWPGCWGKEEERELEKRYSVPGWERSSWETRSQKGATFRWEVPNWLAFFLLLQSLHQSCLPAGSYWVKQGGFGGKLLFTWKFWVERSRFWRFFFFLLNQIILVSYLLKVWTELCSLTPTQFLSSLFVLQGLGLNVVGRTTGSGQRQDGVVDGSHFHSQRNGVLVFVVSCAVILCRWGGLQSVKAKWSAERSLVEIGQIAGLLWKVIPINVVTVGVSTWTLNVYPMALQDCCNISSSLDLFATISEPVVHF